jgi:Flp pilus assembly protein TadG
MRKEESGQSMIEFALILPVVVLLLVAILDFGRIIYSVADLHMAAQETVRKAGLGAKDLEITQFARNYIHLSESSQLQVSISPTEANRHSGDYVKVTLKYPWKLYTPLLSDILPVPEYIESDSTVRVE